MDNDYKVVLAENALTKMTESYNKGIGALEQLEKDLAKNEKEAELILSDLILWQQVQAVFTKVTEFAREQLKSNIENLVTSALEYVFGEGYRFQIKMRELGGAPAAEWQVVSKYGEVEVAADPENSKGGGIVDIVSLALRLAMLELVHPKPGGPILLDEIGKMVSQEYISNLAMFLKDYARKTGRQILLITHAEQLAEFADKSYLVSQKDGVSEVKEIGRKEM